VPVGQDGGYNFGMHALYWLRLNNETGVGDYFYWASSINGGGIYRAKKGTTTVDRGQHLRDQMDQRQRF